MTTLLLLLTSSPPQGPRTCTCHLSSFHAGSPLWPRVSAFAVEHAVVSLWQCFTSSRLPWLLGALAFFYVLFGHRSFSIWEVGGGAPSVSGFPRFLSSLVGPSPPKPRPL